MLTEVLEASCSTKVSCKWMSISDLFFWRRYFLFRKRKGVSFSLLILIFYFSFFFFPFYKLLYCYISSKHSSELQMHRNSISLCEVMKFLSVFKIKLSPTQEFKIGIVCGSVQGRNYTDALNWKCPCNGYLILHYIFNFLLKINVRPCAFHGKDGGPLALQILNIAYKQYRIAHLEREQQ